MDIMHRRIQIPLLGIGFLVLLAFLAFGCSGGQKQAALPGGAATSASTPVPPSFTPASLPISSSAPTFNSSLTQATAVYRQGQTFITWKERDDLQGDLYEVYRSNQPITADNLFSARLIGEVGKNSAAFYTDRYSDADGKTWKARYSDRLIIQDNGDPVPPATGLLVWTLSPDDFGGAKKGSGYYAVVVSLPGRPGTLDPRAAFGPVAEAVAEPAPVEITQTHGGPTGPGGHVYIQYMNLRTWNPTFHAPNSTNAYYGLDSSDPNFASALQYAYDYTVFAPSADMCGGTLPATLPVILHLHGWTANTVGAPAGYPDQICAYGIYPIDMTNTWWFGFAQHQDYRKGSQVTAGDTIVNYTEQRVLRMLYDLELNPPGPQVDQERIYVSGESMGGTGTLDFAERYPNVFAAAYASQPITNFRTAGVTREDWSADAAMKWGAPDLDLPVAIDAPGGWAAPLQKYNGTGVWEWQDFLANASGTLKGRLADEMVPLGIIHGYRDAVVKWDSQGQPVPDAFDKGLRAWAGMVTDDDHYWMYYVGLPPTIGARGPDKITHQPFWRLKVVKNETVPGLSKTSGNNAYSATSPANYNQTIKWSSSWNKWAGVPVDQPTYWQMAFCAVAAGSQDCGTGVDQTVDITPRRLQQFVVTPGKTYTWENRTVSTNEQVASGTVTADENGLITVTGFQVSPAGNRLILAPQG
jgi:hypothetical protein